jgi:D-aminoacyl-tRNA deacylase
MRAVIQRVESCEVTVNGDSIASIGAGLLVYLGIARGDDRKAADYLVAKICGLRIFHDDEGLMNRSAEETGAQICVVSQFTLLADTRKGRRPSWSRAARPEEATPLYEYCVSVFRDRGLATQTGLFGAHMKIRSVNDGPVTIILDTDQLHSLDP